MAKFNIRFADFATRAALFELQVEQDTTVGALKAMSEEHLSKSDDLCPMKYFDKWYIEVQVGDQKRQMGIEEGAGELTLSAAGLKDESSVYLEGPMFEEGQAEVGRAIVVMRAQAKAQAAQHAHQVQGLMAEMGRRFGAVAATQQELYSTVTTGQQSMDAMAKTQSGVNAKLEVMLSSNTEQMKEEIAKTKKQVADMQAEFAKQVKESDANHQKALELMRRDSANTTASIKQAHEEEMATLRSQIQDLKNKPESDDDLKRYEEERRQEHPREKSQEKASQIGGNQVLSWSQYHAAHEGQYSIAEIAIKYQAYKKGH